MTRRRAKMKIRRGVGTVGRDGHGQELMRLGGRWMAGTEREMRERLFCYYQHLGRSGKYTPP